MMNFAGPWKADKMHGPSGEMVSLIADLSSAGIFYSSAMQSLLKRCRPILMDDRIEAIGKTIRSMEKGSMLM